MRFETASRIGLLQVKLINFLRDQHSLFGGRGVWLGGLAALQRTNPQVSVAVKGISQPVWLRLRTSDTSCFRQVLIDSGYDHDFRHPIKTIVDAGAYIGLSSVFYANKYPEAKIVAIEPERSNYQMLKRNVAPYPNIIPLQRALWKNTKRLSLKNRGLGSWAFQTEVAESSIAVGASHGTTFGITLDMVMKQFGFEEIDLLKVDIEGSEKEVFDSAAGWIEKVRAIAIEFHDYLNPGGKAAFDAVTEDFAEVCTRGETVFAERMSGLVRPSSPSDVMARDQLVCSNPATSRVRGRIVHTIQS
jgi:FkbM family methyltransferase